MAVSFVRWLFLFWLVITAPAAFAEGASEAEVNKRAAALAGQQLAEAFPVLAAAMESCDEKRALIDIPHSNKLGVSRRALLLGIGYFHLRTQNECLAPAAQEFFLAARVFERSEIKELGDDELKDAFQFVDVVLENWWRELEAKARYEAEVPEKERAIIESIPGLEQPFDMIRSWNASGN